MQIKHVLLRSKLSILECSLYHYTPHNKVVRGYTGFTMKRGGSLSFLTIFTFAVPELLDLYDGK